VGLVFEQRIIAELTAGRVSRCGYRQACGLQVPLDLFAVEGHFFFELTVECVTTEQDA
jgi:hypothetical protein